MERTTPMPVISLRCRRHCGPPCPAPPAEPAGDGVRAQRHASRCGRFAGGARWGRRKCNTSGIAWHGSPWVTRVSRRAALHPFLPPQPPTWPPACLSQGRPAALSPPTTERCAACLAPMTASWQASEERLESALAVCPGACGFESGCDVRLACPQRSNDSMLLLFARYRGLCGGEGRGGAGAAVWSRAGQAARSRPRGRGGTAGHHRAASPAALAPKGAGGGRVGCAALRSVPGLSAGRPCCSCLPCSLPLPAQDELADEKRQRLQELDARQRQHFTDEKMKLGRLAAIQHQQIGPVRGCLRKGGGVQGNIACLEGQIICKQGSPRQWRHWVHIATPC